MSTFTGIGAALPRSLTVPAARPAADPTPPVPQSQPAVEPTARGKTIAEWLAFVERKPPAPTRHEYSAFRPAGRPLSEGSLRLRSSVAQERTAPPGTVEVFHGTVDARRAPDHRHESARPGVTEGFLSNVDPHRAPGRRTESARPGTVEDFLATVDPHRAPGCRNESARPRVVEDCPAAADAHRVPDRKIIYVPRVSSPTFDFVKPPRSYLGTCRSVVAAPRSGFWSSPPSQQELIRDREKQRHVDERQQSERMRRLETFWLFRGYHWIPAHRRYVRPEVANMDPKRFAVVW